MEERTEKPRETGITIVIDKGLSPRLLEEMLTVSSEFIDYIKFGWGTSLLTPNLKDRIQICRDFNVPVFFGGTLFEYHVLKNTLPQYKEFLDEHNVDILEISDGSIEMLPEHKQIYIQEFSKNYMVFSEVGSKNADQYLPPHKWVKYMREELECGSRYVVAEARESGRGGICHPTGELKVGLMEDFVVSLPTEKIIFEAPNRNLQIWFIKRFGPNVNLGNIATDDVIPLETLRQGLRGDTMVYFHGKNAESNYRRAGDLRKDDHAESCEKLREQLSGFMSH